MRHSLSVIRPACIDFYLSSSIRHPKIRSPKIRPQYVSWNWWLYRHGASDLGRLQMLEQYIYRTRTFHGHGVWSENSDWGAGGEQSLWIPNSSTPWVEVPVRLVPRHILDLERLPKNPPQRRASGYSKVAMAMHTEAEATLQKDIGANTIAEWLWAEIDASFDHVSALEL